MKGLDGFLERDRDRELFDLCVNPPCIALQGPQAVLSSESETSPQTRASTPAPPSCRPAGRSDRGTPQAETTLYKADPVFSCRHSPPSIPEKSFLDRNHRQCREDAVAGIELHGHSGEPTRRGAAH